MAKNKIFQGFGAGAGVAAGTTPAPKISAQVKIATTTPAPKAGNPFSANTNTAAGNPYVTRQAPTVGGVMGASSTSTGTTRAAGTSTTTDTTGWTGGNRSCNKNSDCPNGKVCVNGACWDTTPDGGGRSCTNNNQCNNGKVCVNNQCVTPPAGGGGGGGGGGGTTDPCAGVTCPTGTYCVGQAGGGHACVSVGVPTPPIDSGTPPPTNVCSAANPQGSCPPGQLCDNGSCRPLPSNGVTGEQANLEPEAYYRYLVNRGGLHMNSTNALGAFIADQYDSLYKDYEAARMQNQGLNWKDYLTRTFGPEQMIADFMRRKFLGSSAAQQGYNPSEYGSGPARWSVF